MKHLIFLAMMFSMPAFADWQPVVECDNQALIISQNQLAPNRYQVQIKNDQIASFLGGFWQATATGNETGPFAFASAVLRKFDDQDPVSVAEIYRKGSGIRVLVETRSHKQMSWRWTDSSGYPYGGGCTVKLGRPCHPRGAVFSNEDVNANTVDWFFRSCNFF